MIVLTSDLHLAVALVKHYCDDKDGSFDLEQKFV
jgi:hypothetical protein